MTQPIIWIVDDDSSIRWVIDRSLSQAGYSTKQFENGSALLSALKANHPDVIISDIRMPDLDGITLVKEVKVAYPNMPLIIITAHSDLENTIASFEAGAFEYLSKPFDIDELLETIRHALDQSSYQSEPTQNINLTKTELIGQSPAMQQVFKAIGRLTNSSASVLINGESGTGKELVASALHRHSPRKDGEFIALNMAALPGELIETELFGHERGAFTGASGQRLGRFEQANKGTLFLDEIGDMPIAAQTRLLRVLSNGAFYRVGGNRDIHVDVRIIAATHQNLEKLVKEGRFRADLYHRLNVIRIHIPPLRERPSDIEALCTRFLRNAAVELTVEEKLITPETYTYMQTLDWPGNVRQLENVCSWLTVMAPGQEVHISDLPRELSPGAPISKDTNAWHDILKSWALSQLEKGEISLLDTAVPVFERALIEAALTVSSGRKNEAAKILGWGRNTLSRKIRELKIKY